MCLLNMAKCDERFVFLSKERILKKLSLLILPRNVFHRSVFVFQPKDAKDGPLHLY